jgi:hypothetical protein
MRSYAASSSRNVVLFTIGITTAGFALVAAMSAVDAHGRDAELLVAVLAVLITGW